MKSPEITIIGAGRVGAHLARQLHRSGYTISKIFSRHPDKRAAIAHETGAQLINDLSEVNDKGLIILAIPDDVIAEVFGKQRFTSAILVHTSGTVTSDILSESTEKYGVFYPLQTFSENKAPDWKNIPVCIYSPDEGVNEMLKTIAEEISDTVCAINDEDRQYLHLAAVFANNFTNHIIASAKDILQQRGLDFELLKPLIEETLDRALRYDPETMQTGPAVREDKKTMEKHLSLLKDQPELQKIYKTISENILRLHTNK